MILEVYRTEGVDILALDGTVSDNDALAIKDWVRSLLKQGSHRIVFHLARVSSLSVYTLGTFAERKKEAAAMMAEIKVSGLDARLAETFMNLGGHKVFDVYPSEKEAVQAFTAISNTAGDAKPFEDRARAGFVE